MRRLIVCLVVALAAVAAAAQPAGRTSFNEGWTFVKDGESRPVDLPHDWGVEGAFKQEYPGESGKLAWWGKADYRKTLEITPEDLEKDIDLEIDGAMSHATVEVNGIDLGGWPYGYASFAVRLNPALKPGRNEITVHVDNPEESSRWYPGGGIYRNVWLTKTDKTSVAHWGTYVTTEIGPVNRILNQADATVTLRVTLKHTGEETVGMVRTRIIRQDRFKRDGEEMVVDRILAETRSIERIVDGKTVWQTFDLEGARLWTPDSPTMYLARTTVETPDEVLDTYETPFGVRRAEWKGLLPQRRQDLPEGRVPAPRCGRARSRLERRRLGPPPPDAQGDGLQRHPHLPQSPGAGVPGPVRPDGLPGDGRAHGHLDGA